MNKLTSKLSYEDQLAAAKHFIERHDDFLVVSHIYPDGDAASSTFAMGWILKHLNKRFTMINEGALPHKFDYLWGSDIITDYSSMPPDRTFDHVIALDCADYARIGKVQQLFNERMVMLNIDHHPTNDYFGTVHLIKTDAAATAEVLYDLAEKLQIPWTFELANCIYTGILTDTGGFRYSNTSPRIMQMAANLLQYGVSGHQLAEELLEKLTFSHIFLLKRVLSTLSFSPDNRIGWVSVTMEDIEQTKASNEDLEGLVNYPRNVEGVEVGILFKEIDKERVKVSLRSTGKVDVSAIAQELGGGGHIRAAGCTVAGALSDVIDQVVIKLGKVLS